MQTPKINSLKRLYQELDKVYGKIYKFCHVCKEEDCKGYVWLLPREAKKLLKRNISIIEINKRFYFLDSFSRKEGMINVEREKPLCVFREKNGKCSIYPIRPLICRLYPLDFKILNKKFFIVLHTDCLFIQKMIEEKNISQFLKKVLNVFYNCDKGLLKEVFGEYKAINSISKYPKEYKHDDYFKFLKVVNLRKGALKLCQSAKQFLTPKK